MSKVNAMDLLAAATKGGVSAIPIAGPVIAEILGVYLPNRRLDRLEDFARRLEARLEGLEPARVEAAKADPDFGDRLVEAADMAVRTESATRREHIASLLKNSITQPDLDQIEEQRLLSLLREVNDRQILMLIAESKASYFDRTAFAEQHPSIVQQPLSMADPQPEHDRAALLRADRDQLVRLGLLEEILERATIDSTSGRPRVRGHRVTPLGNLLLRRLDLEPEE